MKKLRLKGKHAVGKYKYALVDDEDFEAVSRFTWWLVRKIGKRRIKFYAVRTKRKSEGGNGHENMLLHHMINGGPKKGFDTDHINRNTMDNRRSNLRKVTRSQNALNHLPYLNNVSGINNISFNSARKQWMVAKQFKSKDYFIGAFHTKKEAAEALKIHKKNNPEMYG